ncbi:MAG: hypothetical protein WCW29_05010, partial [Candidatus Paceibacterota bacterium]
DLGNPEMYDTEWVLRQCAATGTVLCGGIAAQGGEDWRAYIARIAKLVKKTGARMILRPAVFPNTREEAAEMLETWHELT